MASEEKEIFGIKFSKITHSIPTKMQSRGNCSLKSSNILARFLLTHQEGEELFTFDTISRAQGGEGYRPYKNLRQKMVDKAIDNLSKITKKLPKEFTTKLKIYKEISSLYTRSINKAREKIIKETTKLNPSLYLLDKINREKYLSDIGDATSIKMIPARRLYRQIATSHFNFTDQDTDLITNISKNSNIIIDEFLDWDFETSQAKNNFVKLVFEHGDEVKKKSFIDKLVASNPEQRNKFFEVLSQENLSLILTEFGNKKLENSDEIMKELERHIKEIDEKSVDQVDSRSERGVKKLHEERSTEEEIENSKKRIKTLQGDPSSSISNPGNSLLSVRLPSMDQTP